MDILTYGLLNKKVEEAKNVSGEKITEAVNTYLDENPVAPGATSEQAEQIQDNTNKITELKGDLANANKFLYKRTEFNSQPEFHIKIGYTSNSDLYITANKNRALITGITAGTTISAVDGYIACVVVGFNGRYAGNFFDENGNRVGRDAVWFKSITIPSKFNVGKYTTIIIYKNKNGSTVVYEDIKSDVIVENLEENYICCGYTFNINRSDGTYAFGYLPSSNRGVLIRQIESDVIKVETDDGVEFALVTENLKFIGADCTLKDDEQWLFSIDMNEVRKNTSYPVYLIAKNDTDTTLSYSDCEKIKLVTADEMTTVRIKKLSSEIFVAAYNSSENDKLIADYICDGINDEKTIQIAVESLYDGGTVYLCIGDYNIDSWTYSATANGYTAKFAIGISNGNQRTVAIKGFTPPIRKSYAKDLVGTAILHVTSNALDEISGDTVYGNIIGCVGVFDRLYPKFGLIVENIGIEFFDNQHIVMGINAELFSTLRIKNVMVSVKSTGSTDDTSGYQIPNNKCIGIRGLCGSNFGVGYVIEQCFVWGMGVAYDLNGEHLIMSQCGCRFCSIPYRFGHNNKVGINCHDLTLINCCHEGCINGIVFENNTKLQSINLYDYNMEILNAGKFAQIQKATESSPGSGRGIIRYTVTSESSYYKCYGSRFFEAGHGMNFDVICTTDKQSGTLEERPMYPNERQTFFDTTANKMLYYIDGKWVDVLGTEVD